MKQIIALFAIALGCPALLTACNTTKGIGQDISAAGAAIAHGAEKSGAKTN
jgi:predicted small secreted protein